MVFRIASKIASCNQNNTFGVEKVILINNAIISITMYCLSSYSLPKLVMESITNLAKNL